MRIAVTTDFSGQSQEAFEVAGSLATRFSAELYLLHHAQPTILPPTQDVETFYAALEKKLAGLIASQAAFEGLNVQPLLARSGNVINFAKTVKEQDIDLLVMATHGHGGFKRFLFGSFVERAIRFSHCPVLVCQVSAPEEQTTPKVDFRRMLVAHDFSSQSLVAVNFAHQWARSLKAKTRILHVVDTESGITGFEVELFSNWREYHEKKKEEAQKLLQKLVREDLKDIQAERCVTMGHPGLEILSQAEDFTADLIVIGTHGGSVLERHLLGSVAARVIREATCPVLLVREPWNPPEA
jgi:nucleotide-binding universal stress UspA family protein